MINHTFLEYLIVFAPVAVAFLGLGVLAGWAARGWLRKGPTIEQIVAGEDVAAEWAGLWQAVLDEMEGQ